MKSIACLTCWRDDSIVALVRSHADLDLFGFIDVCEKLSSSSSNSSGVGRSRFWPRCSVSGKKMVRKAVITMRTYVMSRAVHGDLFMRTEANGGAINSEMRPADCRYKNRRDLSSR
jgi:hypothetical protein